MSKSNRSNRRFVRIVCALFVVEGALYSAIAPLLPYYFHALHLSRGEGGVLVAAYSAGLIVGSVLAGQLVGRAGPRRTTLLGLGVVGASSVAFGFADNVAALDAFRAAQGCGAGLLWAAGLAWLISVLEPERRGALIGTVLGAAIFGTVIGPVIGTFATVVSTSLVFALVAGVGLALGILVARHPAPEDAVRESGASLRLALRRVQVLTGLWLVLLPAASASVINTLVPLRMAGLGAGGVAVGVTFLLASVIAASTSPAIGRLTDRLGPAALARVALVVVAPFLAVLVLPDAAWGVAVLTIPFLGVGLSGCITPAMTLLTQATEGAGLSLGLGAMVVNISFALGETLGPLVGAKLAQIAGDELPFALLAALTVTTAKLLPAGVKTGQGSTRSG